MPRHDRLMLCKAADKTDQLRKRSMSGEEMAANVTATEFGHNMMKYFLLGTDDNNSDVTFCNHGSYGSTPRYVMDTRFQLLRQVEINPDLWYRSEMLKKELESTQRLAVFVGASSSDLVYIDNVTTGMNIILKVCRSKEFYFILSTFNNTPESDWVASYVVFAFFLTKYVYIISP